MSMLGLQNQMICWYTGIGEWLIQYLWKTFHKTGGVWVPSCTGQPCTSIQQLAILYFYFYLSINSLLVPQRVYWVSTKFFLMELQEQLLEVCGAGVAISIISRTIYWWGSTRKNVITNPYYIYVGSRQNCQVTHPAIEHDKNNCFLCALLAWWSDFAWDFGTQASSSTFQYFIFQNKLSDLKWHQDIVSDIKKILSFSDVN